MDSQKRLWLALGLAFGLTTVYTMYFAPKPPAPAPTATTPTPPVAAAPASPSPSTPAPSAPPSESGKPVPPSLITHDLGPLKLTLTSDGAGLAAAELQGKKMREQPHITFEEGLHALLGKRLPTGPPVDMAFPAPFQPSALAVSVQAKEQTFSPTTRYVMETAADGSVVARARQGTLEVTKVYHWGASGYDFALDVEVKNTGSSPVTGEVALAYARGIQPGSEIKPSFFGGVGNETAAACDIGSDLNRHVADGKPAAEHKGPINFFGMNQQYFLAAIFPMDGPKTGRCVLDATVDSRVATAFFPLELGPQKSYHQRFGVVVGPKDLELLRQIPETMKPLGFSVTTAESSWSLNGSAYPHLEKAVDFGMWAFICKVLLGVLKFFHNLVGNWGAAIILLTVGVKLALLPLTHKSMVSAEAMKKLQPKMEVIRKKFAEDKERQNLEMMKLYREEHVNPLGGCLPMVVQMPIWFALYSTLRSSFDIYQEPFLIWADLTFRDPTYLLPVALGITQIVTQKLQPQMMDAAQARIMTYVMPIFFTVVMVSLPAGLSLYIFTNNLLTVAQQYGLRAYLKKKEARAASERGSGREVHERQPGRKRSSP